MVSFKGAHQWWRYVCLHWGLVAVVALPVADLAAATFNVPPDAAPASIGAGDVLNLADGGVVADDFTATDAQVNIQGGTIGSNFSASGTTQVTLNGGTIGDSDGSSFDTWSLIDTASATINGGEVLEELQHASSGPLTINGGDIRNRIRAFQGSTTVVNGGTLHQFFNINSSATVDIAGGTFFRLNNSSSADITLHGTDFRFNGAPIAGLNTVGDTTLFNLPDTGVLSGNLADGTPFVVYEPDEIYLAGSITLQHSAPPPSGPPVINVPTDAAPLGIRAGQHLILDDGGALPALFNLGRGSMLTVNGGTGAPGTEAVDATVNIHAGDSVGVTALENSQVNVDGGTNIGVSLAHNSTATISGGHVGGLTLDSGSTARVEAGKVDTIFARTGTQITLVGTDFRANGVPVGGLTQVGQAIDFDVPEDQPLSAVLSDGTPVLFAPTPGLLLDPFAPGTLELELAAAPPPPTPLLIHAATDPIPPGIRDGQTIIVDQGASLADHFVALDGTNVVLVDGSVGRNLAAQGANVTLHGGAIGDGFDAFHGTVVTIQGGSIGSNFRAWDGSVVEVFGGSVAQSEFGGLLHIHEGATITIHDGSFLGSGANIDGVATIHDGDFGRVNARNSAVVEINGGRMQLDVEDNASVTVRGGAFGHFFSVRDSSQLTLHGADFRLNGQPIPGLTAVGESLQLNLGQDVLTGTLGDGTPFAFSQIDRDLIVPGALTLEVAPTPPAGPPIIHVPSDPAPRGVGDGQLLVLRNGGELPGDFNAGSGSEVRIHGGVLGTNFEAVDADITITGGQLGPDIDLFGTSTIHVYGTQFWLNSQPIAGLNNVGDTVTVAERSFDRLVATLTDGTPFRLNLCPGDFSSACRTNPDLGGDIVSADATVQLTLLVPGDYDMNGIVDESDYAVWEAAFGSTTNLAADGNFDLVVNLADYAVWRDNFGATLPPFGPPPLAIPEPGGGALLVLVLVSGLARRKR